MAEKSNGWALRAIASAALLAPMDLSCGPNQRVPAPPKPPSIATAPSSAPTSSAQSLRSRCTAAWAAKLLGDDYAKFEKSSPIDKRKNIFALVFQAIATAPKHDRISGNQCLDLLGQPDRWVQAVTGEIVLVYFYSWNGRQMAALITLGPDGYIQNCGINAAEANDYSGFNKG